MTSTYAAIIRQNMHRLFAMDPAERAAALPARIEAGELHFVAFGQHCILHVDGITLNGREETGPLGIVISLYALHAVGAEMIREPFTSFKELPGSMPYVGAFANRTEQALCRVTDKLSATLPMVMDHLNGLTAGQGLGGDWAFIVHPLPKIALCYVVYAADDEFPASVTCLFSNNAACFMPTDGLADVGEYTTRAIIDLAG